MLLCATNLLVWRVDERERSATTGASARRNPGSRPRPWAAHPCRPPPLRVDSSLFLLECSAREMAIRMLFSAHAGDGEVRVGARAQNTRKVEFQLAFLNAESQKKKNAHGHAKGEVGFGSASSMTANCTAQHSAAQRNTLRANFPAAPPPHAASAQPKPKGLLVQVAGHCMQSETDFIALNQPLLSRASLRSFGRAATTTATPLIKAWLSHRR